MGILTLEALSGYELLNSSLTLLETEAELSRTEVQGRHLVTYWEQVTLPNIMYKPYILGQNELKSDPNCMICM